MAGDQSDLEQLRAWKRARVAMTLSVAIHGVILGLLTLVSSVS